MVERSSQKQHNKETYQDHHQFLFPMGIHISMVVGAVNKACAFYNANNSKSSVVMKTRYSS